MTASTLLAPRAGAAAGCDTNDAATSIRTSGGNCFSFHASPGSASGGPLIVFMHGDGGGSVSAAYWTVLTQQADALAAATSARFVVLVRPGYASPGGRSSGSAKSGDDDYTPANVKLAAEAIAALKNRFQASRTVVGGTSGGAATAALVMGRHAGTADAAWLNACPCQVQPWRAWREQSAGRRTPWTASLSPDENLSGVAIGARIVVIAGDKDSNTPPRFSQAYVDAARTRGVDAHLVMAPGATHGRVWRSAEAAAALRGLLR
ncbi:MAG: prolyl oligopeptidase family serine peptidase [Enhydrobacter sp.]|nr:MAG: prolyl oligopeptidase family serine peptidase [Enhydrobacter sp.]